VPSGTIGAVRRMVFVLEGEEIEVFVQTTDQIEHGVRMALVKSGQTLSLEEWQVRDDRGGLLSLSDRFLSFPTGSRFYLYAWREAPTRP
jgi:hypothetical protein